MFTIIITVVADVAASFRHAVCLRFKEGISHEDGDLAF